MPTEEELHRIARRRAEEQYGFYVHLAIYVLANLFLVVVWWMTGGITIGTLPWFLLPLLGWGIALAAHYLIVIREKNYVERIAEKEYERLKRELR
jgi:uncharacterized protein (DUF486 family)